MSEKRFHQFGLWVIDNPNFNRISIADLVDTELMSIDEVVDLLNEQQKTIKKQDIEIQSLNLHIKKLVDGDEISQLLMREYEISDGLEKENEQLKKQIQIYEQLISNSYVGEEETLDGFVGKYVIWEDELQKYKEKIKKVIDDE